MRVCLPKPLRTALALWLCVTAVSHAEQRWLEKKKIPLEPEVEKEIVDFTERGTPAKKKDLTERMEALVGEISNATTATAEEKKILNEAAGKTVDEALAAWKPQFVESIRALLLIRSTERGVASLRTWKAEEMAVNFMVANWTAPEDLPAWRDSIRSCMGQERFATWEKIAGPMREERDQKISAYVKIVLAQANEALVKEMQGQVDDLKKIPNISAAQLDDAGKASQRVLEHLKELETFRASSMLRSANEKIRGGILGRQGYSWGYSRLTCADLEPEWSTELKKILTPEQTVVLEKLRADHEHMLTDEMNKSLQPMQDQAHDLFVQTLKNEAADIASAASLTKEQTERLDQAVHQASEEYLKQWHQKMMERLAAMPETQRAQVFASRMTVTTDAEGGSDPRKIPEWKKKVNEILTPEERTRWEAAVVERDQRLVRSFARLTLVEMDERVFLTAVQREKLEPVVQKLVQRFLAERGFQMDHDYSFGPAELRGVAAGAEESEVRPLLDDLQWNRWKKAPQVADDRNYGGVTRLNLPPAEPAAQAKAPETKLVVKRPEPPSVQSIISEHLNELSLKQAEGQLDTMELRVEELARVAALPPESMARLETAAKGAVESSMTRWRNSMDSWVHSQMRDATPENARMRLESMGSIFLGNETGPQDFAVWKNTVEALLPPDKRPAWQREEDARQEFRERAMAGSVIMQLRRRCPITTQQEERLEPLLRKVVEEYSPDILNWLSEPWYLSSYYCLIPLAGVSEEELSGIFNPDQIKQLKENALPQADQYWEGIKQAHERRLQSVRRRN